MSYINFRGDWNNGKATAGFIVSASVFKGLAIHKAKDSFWCSCCGKEYPKGSKYIGDSHDRLCIFHLKEWCENSLMLIENLKESILDLKKQDTPENKEKWENELVVHSL